MFRSRGCVQTHAIVVDAPRHITCGRLNVHDPSKPSDVLLLGTGTGLLAAYDLHGYRPLRPMWKLDLRTATAALASSDDSPLVCAGSSQGRLDMFDGGYRSHRVAASIPQAHSGTIVAMDMMDNYVLTCGVSCRSINPYDKHAPVKIYPDPLVKLFDLRTMSLVSSIPFPSSSGLPPSFVKFHATQHAYYAADADGDLLVFGMADPPPLQYSVAGHLRPSVTALDVSSSGELFASGTGDGSVVVYESGLTAAPPRALVDEPDAPLDFPGPAARPPLTLSPLETAPASRYVFRPSLNEFGHEITPLSAWLPALDTAYKLNVTLVVAPKPTKVLHPEFEKQRNSFVYGSGRAAALATVDPRSAESPMRRRDSSIGSAKSFDEADPSWHHMDRGCSYKYTEMHLSKHSMDGYVFDFSKHNRSLTHVGLENSLPFAYMNAVLQLLFATPAVTSTLRTHLCDVVNCVCCELAFLCHMMDQTTKYALQKHKSVQTTNFLSALHQIPDVAAAGLFDKTLSILVRVERLFAWLCSTLAVVSVDMHTIALPPWTQDQSFEAIVANSCDQEQVAHELVAITCDPASWLVDDDVKQRWATPGWGVPSSLTLPHGEMYTLIGVISAVVRDVRKPTVLSGPNCHLVTHVQSPDAGRWMLLNDFAVSTSTVDDAVNFSPPWKYPSVLLFRRASSSSLNAVADTKVVPIPSSVFDAAPLNPSVASVIKAVKLPKRGDRVAIDTEFVIVEMEEATLQTDGTRVVIKESRQSLARVSVIHGETDAVIVDDYILPNEPVVDYLTRFSGLTAEDLDPTRSRHAVVSLKTAYMKLRYLVDAGCLFVGHGLHKDFRIVNLFIIDTVELYQQPNMRKIALRFLCAYLLKTEIQLDTHDSIEDARAALRLHNKYIELVAANDFDKTLVEIYSAGRHCRWKIADLE
ncbi:hypothetical protein B5M09_001115 [Aphanomyces astaci]|uniref:Exonuclease domain-containing protein n=1 Tax=Aphanomyces astaci TaxID=112090 RepID=A0A425D6S7_APHAT|nr:hypothetical protein B5M09_001115 [Aphanomyces astaci]